LIHPPGGVVGGDSLNLEFCVASGCRALVTTPGATKLYRSAGPRSELAHDVLCQGSGTFEWLPQETIVYAGVHARSSTRVRLTGQAQFIGWDITCLGHDNRGLGRGHLTQHWQLTRDEHLLWSERAEFQGGSALLSAHWGHGGRTVVGTLAATGASNSEVDAIRYAFAGDAPESTSVTRLGEVLLCRYLGYSAEAARRFFGVAWGILRRRVHGREARPPRVWAT
jgi:urease accessory protein